MNEKEGPPKNGVGAILTVLAQSSNAWVQLGTLGMIAISGFTNWAATWNSADRNKSEIEISRRVAYEGEQRIKAELVRQVQEIHDWMQQARISYSQGNTDSAENRKTLAKVTQELDDIERKLDAKKGGG
jgi:hypothetical protein